MMSMKMRVKVNRRNSINLLLIILPHTPFAISQYGPSGNPWKGLKACLSSLKGSRAMHERQESEEDQSHALSPHLVLTIILGHPTFTPITLTPLTIVPWTKPGLVTSFKVYTGVSDPLHQITPPFTNSTLHNSPLILETLPRSTTASPFTITIWAWRPRRR